MTKFNVQSFLFAFILLGIVFATNRGEKADVGAKSPDRVAATSLRAEITANAGADSAVFPRDADPITAPAPVEPPAPRLSYTASAELKQRVIEYARPEPEKAREPAPVLASAAALAREVGSQIPLFEQGGGRRWPLASLTKLMAAVLATELYAPDEKIILSESAVATEGFAGNFSAGETFSAKDLIAAMLVSSSNDAAMALAEFTGVDEFITKMQARAFDLGLHQTSYFDPTGLSVLNQSTVADTGKLALYILREHPSIFEITAAAAVTVTEVQSGLKRTLVNNNAFAGTPGFKGGKTGYTSDAKGNLLSLFTYGDRDFLFIVFGADDRFGETAKLAQWLKRSIATN